MGKREGKCNFWGSENLEVAQEERICRISWPVGHLCVVMSSRLMCVKNMLIYICGFTRGGCQIILDKAWRCFCIYGTLDLLKGTTKQITDDWFLPPCAKICLSAWFQRTSLPLQARSTSVLQTFGVREKFCLEVREEEGGKWSFKYVLMEDNCICLYFTLPLYWLTSLTLFIFVLKRNKAVIHHQYAGIPHFAFVWYCLSKWLKGLYRL